MSCVEKTLYKFVIFEFMKLFKKIVMISLCIIDATFELRLSWNKYFTGDTLEPRSRTKYTLGMWCTTLLVFTLDKQGGVSSFCLMFTSTRLPPTFTRHRVQNVKAEQNLWGFAPGVFFSQLCSDILKTSCQIIPARHKLRLLIYPLWSNGRHFHELKVTPSVRHYQIRVPDWPKINLLQLVMHVQWTLVL